MRVEKHESGWWVIARGGEGRPQFFGFFVDADRAAWSKWITQARRHSTKEAANETLQQIRERDRLKRNGAKK